MGGPSGPMLLFQFASI
ncbi:DUF6053 domain-containing protein [Lysobacter enzymogenes]